MSKTDAVKNLFICQKPFENFSLEMFELASMICDKTVAEKLNHTPILTDIDMRKFLGDTMLVDVNFFMGNVKKETFYSNTLNEEGVCRTINPINAKLIFREDTIDPIFLSQYQFERHDIEPKFWTYPCNGTHWTSRDEIFNGTLMGRDFLFFGTGGTG